MKKTTIILFSFSTIVLLLTLGPYNPYHHLNAETIVKTSGVFNRERGDVMVEISEVKYLGSNTYLVHVEYPEDELEEKVVLIINKKSKTYTETEIFKYEFSISKLGSP
jgi:hypothetical protein